MMKLRRFATEFPLDRDPLMDRIESGLRDLPQDARDRIIDALEDDDLDALENLYEEDKYPCQRPTMRH